jgi:hypothetical protein
MKLLHRHKEPILPPHILSRYILARSPESVLSRFIEISQHHERDVPQDRLLLSARANQVVVASSVERLHPRVVKSAHQ